MPAGYGIKAPTGGRGLLPWEFVTSRMEASRNYWVATASPDANPHVAPVWGLWHDYAFYFSTDRHSRKGRNLATQPSVVVHLESGDEVVILVGRAQPVVDPDLLGRLDAAYFKKYAFHLDAGQTYGVSPKTVLAWTEQGFVDNATRWQF